MNLADALPQMAIEKMLTDRIEKLKNDIADFEKMKEEDREWVATMTAEITKYEMMATYFEEVRKAAGVFAEDA